MADWRDQVTEAAPAPSTAPAAGDWRSQVTPAFQPPPSTTMADNLVASSPTLKDAQNPYEAFMAGLHMSASVLPFSRPTMQVPAQAGFFTKLAGAVGQGIGDLPANIVGAVGGASAGGAAGVLVPGAGETGASEAAGAIVGGGAGTTALPQAVRETMLDYYADKDKGVMTWGDFAHQVGSSAWNIGKAGIEGAAGGAVASKVAGPLASAAGGSAFANNAANVVSFSAGATGAQAALDRKVPDAQDFTIGAISALGLGVAGHVVTRGQSQSFEQAPAGKAVEENLQQNYRQTGIPPWQAADMAKRDPKLWGEVVGKDVNGDPVMPKFNSVRPPEPENPFSGANQFLVDNGPDKLDSADNDINPRTGRSPFVVARQMPDGSVKYGKPGDVHFNLMSDNELSDSGSVDPKSMGFATPDGGQFLSREQAAAALKQPGRLESVRNQEGDQGSFGKRPPAELTIQPPSTQEHVEQLLPQIRGLESGGLKNPDAAISPTGAVGRYQIQPGTAKQYGFDPTKLHDPQYNEMVARAVLTDLSKRFNGDTEAVLVAYNAGPGRAMEFQRDGRNTSKLPYETQGYLTKAGFGGKGGEPPLPPALPEEPPTIEPPEGSTEPVEPDWGKLSDESMVSRFQDAIGEPVSTPAKGGNFMRQWVSELESARGIDQHMTREGLLDPNKDLTFEDMLRNTYASDDRTNYMMMKGNIDPITMDAKPGPALLDVLDQVKKSGGSMDEFDAYRVAQRTLDLAKRGVDTGVFKGGVSEAANIVQREAFQKYKAINDSMQDWKRGGLEYGRDSGLWGQGNIDAMEAASSHVSLRRIRGDNAAFGIGSNNGKFKTNNPLKAMEGSNKQIVKPLLADIDNMRQIIRMADRNRAMGHLLGGQDALDAAGRARLETMGFKMLPAPESNAMLAEPGSNVFKPYKMTPDQEEALKPFANEANKNTSAGNRFTYYRNGKAEVWEATDPDLAALIRGADNQGEATTIKLFGHVLNLDKLLTGPAALERAGIMGNLDTALTVPGKHQLTAWTLDPLHPPPYITMIQGLHDALTKGDAYWDLMKRGGLSGAMTDLDTAKMVDKSIGDQHLLKETGALQNAWNVASSPLHFAQQITETLTHAERIGYYKRAVDKGIDPNKASMMGRRAYIDFSEKATGVAANKLAKMIPFFRAAMLGGKYVRDGFDMDAKGAFLRVSIGLVGTQMALYALNNMADKFIDDPTKRYSSLPQWERDQYYITPPIMGTRMKLPRPYVIGPMVSVPLERTMEAVMEKDPHAYDNFLSSWLGDMVPSLVPAAVRPALEQITNHNFFAGTPLVSDSLKSVTPDMQYHDSTSEVAKKVSNLIGAHVGAGIANVSPIVLDNYVQAWAGTVGMTVLHALDAPLGKPPSDDDWKDNVFVKGFVVRDPKMNTQQISDFYTDAAKFSALNRDAGVEKKEGDMDQAIDDKTEAGKKASMVLHVEHALTVTRTALDAIQKNDTMTKDDKRQLSERIYQDAWNIAHMGSRLLKGDTVAPEETSAVSDQATADIGAANGKQ